MRLESDSAVRSIGEHPRCRSKRELEATARMTSEFRPLDTRVLIANSLSGNRTWNFAAESPHHYIEETAPCVVNNGKTGSIPRVPTGTKSRARARRRILELLPEDRSALRRRERPDVDMEERLASLACVFVHRRVECRAGGAVGRWRIPEFRVEHRLTLQMASLAIGQGPGLRFRTLTRRMQGPVIRWTGGLAEDFREYS